MQLRGAGLHQGQLLQLAKAAAEQNKRGDDASDRFRIMAERLYGGDWKAASLRFLRDKRILVGCLFKLKYTLNELEQLGFAVANQQGRDRVLEMVTGRRTEWEVSIPAGTPASERLVAADAALEQQGFKAAGGKAHKLLQQLAEVSNYGSTNGTGKPGLPSFLQKVFVPFLSAGEAGKL